MSQRILADRIGMSASHLNRIERDKQNAPAAGKLVAIVRALRLSGKEADDLVRAAGYSSKILVAGGGLSYSAPAVQREASSTDYGRLLEALDALPVEQRGLVVNSLISVIENLTNGLDKKERGGKVKHG